MDSGCQMPKYTLSNQGSFKLGDANATVSGATNIDFKITSQTAIFPSPSAAQSGAAQFLAGGVDERCRGGVKPSAQGEVVDLTPCLSAPNSLDQYTIFQIIDGRLHLGQAAAGALLDGRSIDHRIDTLIGALVFDKQ